MLHDPLKPTCNISTMRPPVHDLHHSIAIGQILPLYINNQPKETPILRAATVIIT